MTKKAGRLRLKLLLWALGALITGSGLMVLSRMVMATPVATQPAETAATQPASATQPADPGRGPRNYAAQNLSNMLLLCGLLAFAVAAISAGWLIIETRRQSLPAWKRHPKKRW